MPTIQEALERVWNDEFLKNRLLTNPKPVLSEFGLEIPDTISVKVHENTATRMNFVIPAQAAMEGIDPESADPIAGKVMKRAWADREFKWRLLSNPRATIQEAAGIDIPANIEVNVYENSASLQHLVLPPNPNDSELSDADLEGVAGGLTKAFPRNGGSNIPCCVALGYGGSSSSIVIGGGGGPLPGGPTPPHPGKMGGLR